MRFIGANGLPTGFTTYTMQPSSTVEYSNSGSLELYRSPGLSEPRQLVLQFPGLSCNIRFW